MHMVSPQLSNCPFSAGLSTRRPGPGPGQFLGFRGANGALPQQLGVEAPRRRPRTCRRASGPTLEWRRFTSGHPSHSSRRAPLRSPSQARSQGLEGDLRSEWR